MRGIYAIVDPAAHESIDVYTEALLRGGIRLVQVRDKRGPRRADVERLHALCARFGASLIVNDDLALGRMAGGVHLGQEDLAGRSIAQIRAQIGDGILGVSAATPREAREAFLGGADYIGAGPFRVTASKADAGVPIGAAGLRKTVEAEPRLPVAAIGGITIDDLEAVAGSGARMAAVISALAGAPDPSAAAHALVARWEALTA